MEPIDPSTYWDDDEILEESIHFIDESQEIITHIGDINGRNSVGQREKIKDGREYFKRKLKGK